MTGNSQILSDIIYKDDETGNCGDNPKRYVDGIDNVCNYEVPLISNVLLAKILKHNLLSISHLCNNNYKVWFEKDPCIILNEISIIILMKKERIIFIMLKFYA
jgi:hypothetical protein